MPALITVYFVAVGVVLVVAPWTMFWDRNYFAELFPFLEAILTNHVVRGGVTGVGLVSLGAALVDVAGRDSAACDTGAFGTATG